MYIPTAKSYFSGGGGLDEGFIQAGINIIQSLEVDKYACMTLERNHQHKVLRSNIESVTVLDQPKTDIIVGAYPCTKYSAIADIHGTRNGDDLFLHFFRHVALERPEAFAVENVPGMKKFPVVMEAMTKIPEYYITTLCPVDAENWLPQRRERLLIVGTRRPHSLSVPRKEKPVKLKQIIERGIQVDIPDYINARINGQYRDKPIVSDPEKDDLAPCCVAHYGKDRGTRMVVDHSYPDGVRPYTVREYARLQGFPDSYQFVGSQTEQYKQIGNAVPVPMARWLALQLLKYFN